MQKFFYIQNFYTTIYIIPPQMDPSSQLSSLLVHCSKENTHAMYCKSEYVRRRGMEV